MEAQIPYASSPAWRIAKTLITITIITAIVGVAVIALSNFITIRNDGRLKTIGVEAYQDPQYTIPLTVIHWGTLDLGETKNVTAYLRNEGNTNIILALSTANYTPPISEFHLTTSWNYDDTILTPNETRTTIISLTVALDSLNFTDFNFDILIEGIET